MSIADKMGGMAHGGAKHGISEHMGHERPDEHEESHSDVEHSELHAHGDGTFHTVAGGEHTEHPHIGHALMHLAGHHEPDGAHTHVHHGEDGMHTSHHSKEGAVSGPHDHENLEALKSHMGKFLDEEESEHDDGGSPFGY